MPTFHTVCDKKKKKTQLTCLTQDTSVTRLTHTGETASALYTRGVVEARHGFALVNVCNTHMGRENIDSAD